MRFVGLALVLALATVAYLTPAPDAPEPSPGVGIEEPPVAVCAVEEGSGRTTEISVLSTVDGQARLTLFAAGGTAGTIGQRTGASGSTVFPVVDVAAVGSVGGLIEMPVVDSATASVVLGATSIASEACATVPASEVLINGGSTISGETFVLQLMNPYAGEAVTELVVASESGVESNDQFERVIVPPRSSTFIDFTDLVPGRESLSVSVETATGRVLAVGRQGAAGGSAMWRAVSPALDWFLPVPQSGGVREILISSPSASEVEYQIDVYAPSGIQEGVLEGSIPARGQTVIDLEEFGPDALGVRVVSAGPVVPTLRIKAASGIGMTTGSEIQANQWLLPGAGRPEGGNASVIIFNTGIEDDEVRIRPLRENTSVLTLTVESGTVLEFGLDAADGYLIESTGPSVVSWAAAREGALALAGGVAILDE